MNNPYVGHPPFRQSPAKYQRMRIRMVRDVVWMDRITFIFEHNSRGRNA